MLEGAEILQQLLRSDHFYIYADPANFIPTTDFVFVKIYCSWIMPHG